MVQQLGQVVFAIIGDCSSQHAPSAPWDEFPKVERRFVRAQSAREASLTTDCPGFAGHQQLLADLPAPEPNLWLCASPRVRVEAGRRVYQQQVDVTSLQHRQTRAVRMWPQPDLQRQASQASQARQGLAKASCTCSLSSEDWTSASSLALPVGKTGQLVATKVSESFPEAAAPAPRGEAAQLGALSEPTSRLSQQRLVNKPAAALLFRCFAFGFDPSVRCETLHECCQNALRGRLAKEEPESSS